MHVRHIVFVASLVIVAASPSLARGGEPPAVRVAPDLAPIQPSIAVDADGAVHLAFIGGPGETKDIWASVSRDGGASFGAPVKAIDVRGQATGGRQRGPRVGVDGEGRVYVSCVQQLEGKAPGQRFAQGDVWLVVSRDGGATFGAPVQCNDRRGAAETEPARKSAKEGMHWMAVEDDGTVHLCWLDHRLAPKKGQMVAYAKVTGEGAKVSPNVIAYAAPDTVCQCCTPGIAVDRRGNPVIAFRNALDGDNQVWLVRSTDGGKSFRKAGPVTSAKANIDQCPMDAPSIAVTPDGKKLAVTWMDQRAGRRNAWLRLPSGKEVPLAAAPGAQQGQASVALDADGAPWAVWTEIGDGGRAIYGIGPGAKAPVRLSSPDEDEVGFSVVAWSEKTGPLVAYEANGGVVVRRWPR